MAIAFWQLHKGGAQKVIAYLSKYSNFYNLLLFKLYLGKQMLALVCSLSHIDNLHNPKTQEITAQTNPVK